MPYIVGNSLRYKNIFHKRRIQINFLLKISVMNSCRFLTWIDTELDCSRVEPKSFLQSLYAMHNALS